MTQPKPESGTEGARRIRGPYSDGDTALEATRAAIADQIGEGDDWPSHGNAPLAIAALVATQVTEIKTLTEKLEKYQTDLRHWREECGKLHGSSRRMVASLRDAANRLRGAGMLAEDDEILAALSAASVRP